MEKRRCEWCLGSEQMVAYHDTEWGVPLFDDRKLFEFMTLDAFQAGLSWAITLKKREGFRKALADFRPERIARFNRRSVERLLRDRGIIRNRQKIVATLANAKAFVVVQDEVGSFADYIWQFVDGRPRQNKWRTMKQIPAKTRQSDAMSAALRERGFKFVGSTICYAFMQAAGMVNDHVVGCHRYGEIQKIPKRKILTHHTSQSP